VAAELALRRVHLLAEVAGAVLDLDLPRARAEVAAAGEHPPARSGAYDTVLSTAQLVGFPDLGAALRGIERLLAPEGELIIVEPVHHPGALATVYATMWSHHPAVAGLHVERDVCRTVRSVGFVVTTIERFSMPTSVWPLRRFVSARARRFPGYPAVPA